MKHLRSQSGVVVIIVLLVIALALVAVAFVRSYQVRHDSQTYRQTTLQIS